MSSTVGELREWLKGRKKNVEIAIDDGGLSLVSVDYEGDYIEIGGVPQEKTCDVDSSLPQQ
jgi:hypothetical protein